MIDDDQISDSGSCEVQVAGCGVDKTVEIAVDIQLPGVKSILGQLGKGNFAKVYRCESETHGEVAIKIFNVGVSFRQGFDAVVGPTHPNLVQIHRVISGVRCAIVMELCGQSLHDALHSILPCSAVQQPGHRLRAALDVASGLQFLHSKMLMHRDVSSKNCLLSLDQDPNSKGLGEVKLGDFMTARSVEEGIMTSWTGTMVYMAPETVSSDYGYAADVFALGILIHEAACRQVPFAGRLEDMTFLLAVTRGLRPRTSAIPTPSEDGGSGQESRQALIALLEHCWQATPRDRPSVANVASRLVSIVNAWTPNNANGCGYLKNGSKVSPTIVEEDDEDGSDEGNPASSSDGDAGDDNEPCVLTNYD